MIHNFHENLWVFVNNCFCLCESIKSKSSRNGMKRITIPENYTLVTLVSANMLTVYVAVNLSERLHSR